MTQYIFLSDKFYNSYPKELFPELIGKENRPYILININNYQFALPLRSHIRHSNAFISDKQKHGGIDFSKAILISDSKFINFKDKPRIRTEDHNTIKSKRYIIESKFMSYIKKYVTAYKSGDKNRIKDFQFSTLSYFDNLIDYSNFVEDYYNNKTAVLKYPVNQYND